MMVVGKKKSIDHRISVTWRENIRPNAHIAAISGGLFVETN
jgi:hypothetical protein